MGSSQPDNLTVRAVADLDHCPVCDKKITDTDDNGMELPSGQRWCISDYNDRFNHLSVSEQRRKFHKQGTITDRIPNQGMCPDCKCIEGHTEDCSYA